MKRSKQKIKEIFTTKEFITISIISIIIWQGSSLFLELGALIEGLLVVLSFGIGILIVFLFRKLKKGKN